MRPAAALDDTWGVDSAGSVATLLVTASLTWGACGGNAAQPDGSAGSGGVAGHGAAASDGGAGAGGGDAGSWTPVTKLAMVFSEGGGDFTSPQWVRAAADGSIYIAGPVNTNVTFYGRDRGNVHMLTTASGAFLLKLDPAGQLLWAQGYAQGVFEDAYNWLKPALAPDGSVFRAGPHGPIHGDTPYVERIGPDGQRLWVFELTMGAPFLKAVAVTPQGDALVVGRIRYGDDIDLGPTTTLATAAGQMIFKLSGATGELLWSRATTDPEWMFPLDLAVDADGSPIVDGWNASAQDPTLQGFTESFLRLTPGGDRGAGSWVRTFPAGTAVSPWTLAPPPVTGAAARIIAVSRTNGVSELDTFDAATGAPTGPGIALAYLPYTLAATADAIASFAADGSMGIDRWNAGGQHVGTVNLPRLLPEALAFDGAGALYVTFDTALTAGEQIALGPGPGAPTFQAPTPAVDNYFTLLVLAPWP